VGGAGTYPVTVSATGYITNTTSVALTCGGTTTIQLRTTAMGSSFCITVFGCCTTLENANVTIAGITTTTDNTGLVCTGITAPGTYSWSVSKTPRFVTQTGTFTISSCSGSTQTIGVTLAPASGFACALVGGCGGNCCGVDSVGTLPAINDPLPTTMTLTDSVAGTCTMTYGANCLWTGSLSYSTGTTFCYLAPATTTITYTFPELVQCENTGAASQCGIAVALTGCLGGGETGSPCCDPPFDPTTLQSTGCCTTGAGGAVEASSIASTYTVPLDLAQTMVECTPNFSVVLGHMLCGCADSAGMCYAIGAAPVYTLTE
jgi:hypothetical protein